MRDFDTKKNYTREELHEERKYEWFWYSGLWSVLRPVAVFLSSILIVYGIAMTVWNYVDRSFFSAIDKDDKTEIAFIVESGSSLSKVARNLEAEGLVRSGSLFKYYADFMGYGQKIQAGNYSLNKTMTMLQIANTLTTGDGNPLTRDITIIPGWTVQDIAAYLEQEKIIDDRESFLQLCRSGTEFRAYYYIEDVLRSNASQRLYVLEGYLAPDTYEIYTNSTPASIIQKLLSQTEAVYTQSYHDRTESLNMTLDDIITLASMIEKEAKNDDFAKVSAVFHNRLKQNIALQSDVTVKYVTGVTRVSLNNSDLSVQSPYNTYINKGLPPGPVCNPSAAAIQAALYPDESYLAEGYLFFCAKEPSSGELYFSKTYEEHQRAVDIYRPLWEAYDREHSQQ